MVITVLCTANHYLVDAIAGAALTALCWMFVGALRPRRAGTMEPLLRKDFDPLPALAGQS
jgi:membrane-associated phospholipid phosphatase